MPNEPVISAVVCSTGTRSFLLKTVLSLLDQTLASDQYEILVVLNHPAPRELDSLRVSLSPALERASSPRQLRLVQERTSGLSHARNLGIREARGRYLAYIDDDAIAQPDWLEQIIEGFANNPDAASVGGAIDPLWEREKPWWVTPPMFTYFSCRNFGDTVDYMAPGAYFFGTNMAFTRQILESCGGFSTHLGRKGNNLLSNEEWPVFQYLDDQGFKKWYSPAIRVQHLVPVERMTIRFFIRRLWWQGVSNTIHSLEYEGLSRSDVAIQAWHSFLNFYAEVPNALRYGNTSIPLSFFNLFRWAGIIQYLSKDWLVEKAISVLGEKNSIR